MLELSLGGQSLDLKQWRADERDRAVHVSDLRCGKLAAETMSNVMAAWKITLNENMLMWPEWFDADF